MDAFYASVEQKDEPSLKGKPVIVGARPEERGVVAACSYEARKFGVHSAMSTAKALRLCPDAVIIKPRFDRYRYISGQIHEIFREYTDAVEPLSLDEAYLDVTKNKKGMESASIIANEIRKKISDKTGLSSSAGVSYNKFLAKVASDYKKPGGTTVVTPGMAANFIEKLPVRKFHGIGKVTERKMRALGIKTGAGLKKAPAEKLEKEFGKAGVCFHKLAFGIDGSPVLPEWKRKSYGKEETFAEDITDPERIHDILEKIAFATEEGLKKLCLKGRTVTLKVKYHDFTQITRSCSPGGFVEDADIIMDVIRGLLKKTMAGKKSVRLLGITVSGFEGDEDAFHSGQKSGQMQMQFNRRK